VKVLVDYNADCNVAGGPGDNTPLHDAVKVADEATSRCLVELMLQGRRGVDLTAKNKQKKTPADIARHESVKQLLHQHQTQKQSSPGRKLKNPTSKGRAAPARAKAASASATGSPARADAAHVTSCSASPAASGGAQEAPSAESPKPLSMEERLAAMRGILEVLPHTRDESDAVTLEEASPVAEHPSLSSARKRLTFPSDPPAGFEIDQAPSVGPSEKMETSRGETAEDRAVGDSPGADHDGGAELMDAAGGDGLARGLISDVQQMLLSGNSWEMRFTREFKEQMFAMHSTPVQRDSLIRNILRLANGEQTRGLFKQLKGSPRMLAIFESPVKSFADGDRFLWTRSVGYSQRIQGANVFCFLVEFSDIGGGGNL